MTCEAFPASPAVVKMQRVCQHPVARRQQGCSAIASTGGKPQIFEAFWHLSEKITWWDSRVWTSMQNQLCVAMI